MTLDLCAIHHVQITIAEAEENSCKIFYGSILGLRELPKPANLKRNGGAWYRLGDIEIHLSVENVIDNQQSKRHICYTVPDLSKAERALRSAGVEIIPDKQPIDGWVRFYVRDPGGNRMEIAQTVAPTP